MTLTSMISSGASNPEFGLTQYRFGAVVLILKATYDEAFAFLSISDAVDTLRIYFESKGVLIRQALKVQVVTLLMRVSNTRYPTLYIYFISKVISYLTAQEYYNQRITFSCLNKHRALSGIILKFKEIQWFWFYRS